MFIMFWSLVVCFMHSAPWVLIHALAMHLTCTLDAPCCTHSNTLSCLGLHHVPLSLACHIFFMLYGIFKDVFCLMFELHFLIHLAPLMHHLLSLSYLLFFPTFLLIHLSIRDKKGECILSSFLYDPRAHS